METNGSMFDVEVDFNNDIKTYYLKDKETVKIKNLKLSTSGLFQINARVSNYKLNVNPLVNSK